MVPLGLQCSIASRPALEALQAAVEGVEERASGFQPISHQHGLVEVTSPLRFPSAYKGQDGNIITANAAVARKYLSSPTAYARLLAPNASIPRDCLSTPSGYERPDGNIITVGPNDPNARNSRSSLAEHSFSVAGCVDDLLDKW